MEAKQTQKDIPHGWSHATLGKVTSITNGSTNTQDAVIGGEYPLFDRSIEIKKSNKYLFDDTAIILPGEGAEFVPRIYSGKFDLHQRAYAILPDKDLVNPEYLFHFLYFNRKDFLQRSVGSTVKSLRLPLIQSVDVSIPPIKEQQKIAEILGTVDEDIAKTQEVIETTEKLKRGLMQQLFTRGISHTKFKQSKLGEIPWGWEVVSIQELIDRKVILENQDGNHGDIHPKASDYVSEGIPFISASDVRNGRVDLVNCHFLSKEHAEKLRIGFAKENDVLLTHKGSVGNVAIVPKIDTSYVLLTPQVTYYRLNSDLIDNVYLAYVFQSDYFQDIFKSSSRQSTRDFLSITNQRKLIIPFSRNLCEQEEIAKILKTVDEKISVNKKIKEKLTLLKKGLMQDLLSGKVRTGDHFSGVGKMVNE